MRFLVLYAAVSINILYRRFSGLRKIVLMVMQKLYVAKVTRILRQSKIEKSVGFFPCST